MGKFMRGAVVVLPFPFSNLSASKRRPALVLASLTGDDVIRCQITSKALTNNLAIDLADGDFATSSLHQESSIRPDKLFTADSRIIAYQAGSLNPIKIQEVVTKLIELLTI